MVACQNQKDMWRCGESQYFNGYKAEDPDTDENDDPVYLRDFFPGPFRNYYDMFGIALYSRPSRVFLLLGVQIVSLYWQPHLIHTTRSRSHSFTNSINPYPS